MSRALYLVRVRGKSAAASFAEAQAFIAGVSPMHEAEVIGMISFKPRAVEAVTERGKSLLARVRTERELLRAAKRMRFDHQVELILDRVGGSAGDKARKRYLRWIGPGREGAFFRRLISPLKPDDMSIDLRRHIYECFVAYAQNTTRRSFPFATIGAHFESCRLFDLGGRGRARYVLAEAERAEHAH